jgi:hypothetical protein
VSKSNIRKNNMTSESQATNVFILLYIQLNTRGLKCLNHKQINKLFGFLFRKINKIVISVAKISTKTTQPITIPAISPPS